MKEWNFSRTSTAPNIFLTPEKIVEFQEILGSDIMMVLDECVHYPCEYDHAKTAMRRTLDWASRSKRVQDLRDKNHKPSTINHQLSAFKICCELKAES